MADNLNIGCYTGGIFQLWWFCDTQLSEAHGSRNVMHDVFIRHCIKYYYKTLVFNIRLLFWLMLPFHLGFSD